MPRRDRREAGQQVSVGLPLAGQMVTLRLEGGHHARAGRWRAGAVAALAGAGRLPGQAAGRQAARGALAVPQGPVVVHRRVSPRGQIRVAGERVQVGFAHARQVVTVQVAEREFRIFDEEGLIKVIPRRDHQSASQGLV